jgi:hypothetical protein
LNQRAFWDGRPSPRPRSVREFRFLERQGYPAERLAVGDAVSDFDGSAVLVTRFVEGVQLRDGAAKFAMMGALLGRLHALPYDDSAGRPGGASSEDPSREGTPRQDLLPWPAARHSTSGASSNHPSTSAPPQPQHEPRSAGRSSVRQGNDGGPAAPLRNRPAGSFGGSPVSAPVEVCPLATRSSPREPAVIASWWCQITRP